MSYRRRARWVSLGTGSPSRTCPGVYGGSCPSRQQTPSAGTVLGPGWPVSVMTEYTGTGNDRIDR